MKHFNFLSNLLSLSKGSQSSDVSLDRRLTVGSPSGRYCSGLIRLVFILAILLTVGVGNAWGTTLFHETFGNNTGSARDWNNSYSVKSGVSAVYSGITGYTVSNCKQGKNTTGSTQSGLNQTTQGTDAYIIIGPLSVASYSSLGVTYQWKAGSIKGTYTTKLYYATSSGGSYTEVSGTGTGATTFVGRSYSLPVAAQVSTLYLKIVWNTSNTQAIIDEVELTGTAAASCDKKVTIVKGTPETGGSFKLDKTGAQDCCSALTVTVSNITAPSGKEFDAITQSGIATGVTINQSAKTVTYAANSTGTSTINVTFRDLPKYTVTLMDDGDTHTQASYGASVTLPSRTGCTGYTFAGWTKTWVAPQSSWTTTAPTIIPAGSYTPSANENLYPVYTKTEGGEEEETEIFATTSLGSTNTVTTGYAVSAAAEAKSGYYQDGSGTTRSVSVSKSSTATAMISSIPTIATVTATLGGGTTKDPLTNNVYAVWLDASGNELGDAVQITSKITNTTGSDFTANLPVANATSAYGVRIKHQKETSYNVRYYAISLSITTGGSTTYYISVPDCCTKLGSINGSVNLTTSSTGTSVTVSVNTDGVNAYGDANNVSGYDFKLYTASAGGSAAATYSSDSKAGTSHEFTELTPLTQYWVTVRPIGSGSYCNTTAESDRVAIYTCPGSPNHVDVSGRWDRFGGETISLTAAAYATAGTGTAIPAAKITGYQWQKYYNSIWNDISNGGTTSGATTNNLQITNCSNENSGSYRCVVSTVAGCDIASDGFQVKVYALECYNSGTTVYNFTRTGDTQAGTVQIDLSASTNYGYKVHADNDYYGNSGTVNEDVTNWEMSTGVSNNLTVASGLGGTFTFAIDYSTGGNNSTEGIPEISVTYPRKTIYLTPGVWNSGEAKFAFYYFRKVGETIYGEGFTDFITADDCGSSAEIPLWNGVKINAVRLNSNTTASDLTNSANHYKAAWDKKWNQTSNITITSNNSVSITGWGPDKGDSPYDYGTYAVPTYTISYAKGSVPTGGGSISGSKANETKTCGVDFTLPAAQFTTTGYVQTGWSKADGGAQYAAVSGSYTDNSAQTFYPVWTANTHTLTWDKNGGDALTGDYTSGTVAYATAITAPNTPTWTGHTFGGWHNGTSIVTPATAMPDNDLTYTAQWSLATYTVTLNTNGGTINVGDVDEYTYGTGATLPTNVTRDGFRFDGWFDNSYCTGDAVTSISSSATGDKAFWAKWTQVYTVTWSVNGETWSSGVVEGNTHVPGGSQVSALPTAPTSSDCDDAKVFMGWRAFEIDGTSVSDPGGIFTTQAGSPTISANTTFYAVFADSNEETKYLTNSEIQTFHTADASNHNNYAKGPFTLTSSDGNWYGVFISQNDGGVYTANVKEAVVTLESTSEEVRPYIMSPTYSDNINSISILATHGSNTSRTLYVCSAATATPASNNIGSITVTKNNSTPQEIIPSSTATTLYLYAAGGAIMIKNIDVNIGSPSNYVTSCSSCDADATFTNTTPTVSEIGCTGATLTMEGGLKTWGAEGCNISDYGFVIGTSDNPAIGGSGVTKYQVGTSNPTIGDDFSYEATDLTKGTRYYIRAYAINRHGTAYSTSTNFWTKNVSSIAITTAPTKTNYIVGETFDATGMVVTATLASSATEDVTSDVTYSSSALTAGTSQNFAINYTLCETEKSVNQVINVYTLTVTEGTNPSYGTAAGSVNVVSITGLGDHKTYTVTVTSDNADVVDNGDNTWSVINPTGNVTVRVDYADAVQVKVYYKVDGVTVTGLTRDVYQSETTTLPTASDLATAMTAQGMDLPDDDYPNFVGWSETEFSSQTSEPTIVSGTPTINAEKTYYAVYTNLSKITIIPSDFSTSYPSSGSADGTKTFGGKRFGWNYLLNGNVSKTNLPLQFKKNATEYGRLYNTDPLNYILRVEIGYYNADSYVPVYVASSAGTISGDALTPASRESTDPYVYTMPASTSYFYIKGDNSTVYKIRSVDIYYSPATVYYMTQFCTNRVILTQNSPEHGTVEFSRSSLVTCGSDKEVSLTIIPDVGYQLTGWTVNTSSGYADAKTTDPAVVTNSNNSAAQNITLTFAEDANKDYDVTATFALMTVESWTWTYNSAAMPNPLNLYIGQSARLDVAYTPAGVDNSKKTYTRTKEDAYINWVGVAQSTYTTISGRASTGENTTPVTFTHGDGPTTTVNVKVLPLPLVHFGDIVHNVSFDDVVATLSDNTLSPTKTTPTHADFDGSTANTCEEQHLHLVGWIREDWPSLVTYLNGGAQPGTDDITGAGNDASGNAYFFEPGASINTQTFNGVTFYAVWAKVE